MDELTAETMFHGLLAGKEYTLKERLRTDWELFQRGRFRFFAPQANIYMDEDGEYFHWSFFGSSANKVSFESLEWLLEKIFQREASDFVELDKNSILDVINEGR